MSTTRRDRSKGRPGQSLVEVALILPIVLIVITGLGEFTWIFWNFVSIGNAAHEGARHGAVGNTYASIEAKTKQSMIGVAITTVTIDVFNSLGGVYGSWTNGVKTEGLDLPAPGATRGSRFTVRVTAQSPYGYLTVLPRLLPMMTQLQEVRGTSTALIEADTLTPIQ